MQVTFSLADALRTIDKSQENEPTSAVPIATPQVLDPLALLPTLNSSLAEPCLIDPTPSQSPEGTVHCEDEIDPTPLQSLEGTVHCDYEIDPILFKLPEGTEWNHDDVDLTILGLTDWSDEPVTSCPNDLDALWEYPAKKLTEETLTPEWAREMSDRKDQENPRRMRDYRIQMMEAGLYINLVRRAKGRPLLDPEKQTMAVVQEENVKRHKNVEGESKKRKREEDMGTEERDANPRPVKAMKRSHPNVGQDRPTFKIPGLTLI
jgi:hypothetical protein